MHFLIQDAEGTFWSAEALEELLGGGGGGGGGGSSEVPLPTPTRRMSDEDNSRADVDNSTAGRLFLWLGRDAAERCGVHAGTHLGTTRMVG